MTSLEWKYPDTSALGHGIISPNAADPKGSCKSLSFVVSDPKSMSKFWDELWNKPWILGEFRVNTSRRVTITNPHQQLINNWSVNSRGSWRWHWCQESHCWKSLSFEVHGGGVRDEDLCEYAYRDPSWRPHSSFRWCSKQVICEYMNICGLKLASAGIQHKWSTESLDREVGMVAG